MRTENAESVCGKGNVIKMKQKKTLEGKMANIKKPSIRKVGTMLGAGIICVLTIGTIGAMSVIGNSEDISGKETTAATNGATTAAAENAVNERTTEISGSIEWRKAGFDEYDLVDEAEKVTKAKTKKSTAKTTVDISTEAEATALAVKASETAAVTARSSKVTSVNSKTMYVKEAVNFRTGASKSFDVIKVLSAGKKVTVNGKTNDGWYRIKVDGVTGYCMAEYLTSDAPKKKTTAANSTQSAASNSNVNSGTISYTNEEFEMMCYVLQNEAGGCSEESKIAVANVIINRVKSPNFPDTLGGVLTSNNQFTAISNYYNKVNAPTQNTIDCARRALNGEDNSNGALFYYAPKYCGASTAAWFESLSFCMEMEGQRFFKY